MKSICLVIVSTQQNLIIATKCNTNAKCNKVINAKCSNFPTQNVITILTQITFLMQNVIMQIVKTPELQVCST